ncbi:MAG: multiheme c-type cytochrome [Anaerolineales bacterium]
MRASLLLAAVLLLLTLLLAALAENRQPRAVALTPSLTGETEYCLTCHADLDEISPSHPLETFGCVLCHGGERLALDADLAHSSMRGGANPSDLSVATESCGGEQCHSGDPDDARDHIQRVVTSVQATYAGAIAKIRYTYGAQPDLNAYLGTTAAQDAETASGIAALGTFDPAQEDNPFLKSFSENCLHCHLYAEPQDGPAYSRFTGCSACHTPISDSSEQRQTHTLTTVIPYTQCNTCHNRGNYDLRLMTFVERTDQPTSRLEDYYQPIAQFTRCEYTLDCVDCHTRMEAMGDGDIHANKQDIQYIQCQTCHGTLETLPLTKTLSDPNDLAFRLAFLNPVIDLALGNTIIVTQNGEALWNTRLLPDGTYELFGKATGQRFTFRPVIGSDCQQNQDEQGSQYCHECHAVEH